MEIILGIFAVAFLAVIFIVSMIGMEAGLTFGECFLISLIITAVFAIIYVVCVAVYEIKDKRKNRKWKKEQKEILKQKADEKERERQQVLAGTWDFPTFSAGEFCRFCHENQAENLDSEYALQKAKAFVVQAFEKVGYTEEDCKAYLNTDRMKAMLEAGEAIYQREEREKRWELTKTRTAKLNEGEERYITRAESLAKLQGEKKRIQMIQDLRDDYKTRIGQLLDGEQAMRTLGMIYSQQQRKESDWAVVGGIADGIAGPGAGVAAALNTMASNEQIRRHNDSMQKAARAAINGQLDIASNRHSLQEQLPIIEKDLEIARTKIAFDYPSASEIWNQLDVGDCSMEKDEKRNVLNIKMRVQMKEQLPVKAPDGAETVIDGVLRGTVMCDEIMVGTIYLPLPIYGVPNHKAANWKDRTIIEGFYDRYVNYQGKYTIKFDDTQNLWIMEA